MTGPGDSPAADPALPRAVQEPVRSLAAPGTVALPPGAPTALSRRRRRRWIPVLAILGALALAEPLYRLLLLAGAPGDGGPGFDLYAIGDSTATGDPYPRTAAFPVLVSRLLGDRVGDLPIRIRNLGHTSDSTYPQARRLRNALVGRDTDRPGAVLIYSGNNDGILGAGRPYHDERGWAIERASTASFLLSDALYALRRFAGSTPDRSIQRYEFWLRMAIESARDAGLVPILATVAGNVGGVEPNVETDDASGAAYEEGRRLEAAGRLDAALAHYRGLLASGAPDRALLEYGIGRCLRTAGDRAGAREAFWQAIRDDPQTVFVRATAAQNDLLRRLAREYGIALVDTVVLFEAASPAGVIDGGVFADGHHPNMEGNRILATALAAAVAKRFGALPPRSVATAEEALALLGVSTGQRVDAHVRAAGWLIATASLHPAPIDRLELAESNLRSALALDPRRPQAWFDLALVQAHRRSGLLRDRATVDRLSATGAFYRHDFCVDAKVIASFEPLLAPADAHVLAALRRAVE